MDRLRWMEEAAGLLGIHPQTLRAWDVQGKIRVVRTPGGKRRVPESEIRRLQGQDVVGGLDVPSVWAVYGRVSTHEQKARGDLARQVVHVRETLQVSQGVRPSVEITDVASGLSDKRRGLLRLMALARSPCLRLCGRNWPVGAIAGPGPAADAGGTVGAGREGRGGTQGRATGRAGPGPGLRPGVAQVACGRGGSPSAGSCKPPIGSPRSSADPVCDLRTGAALAGIGSKGFGHQAREIDGGDWEVRFEPQG